MRMRDQCEDVFPSPHMFKTWEIPGEWDPTVFMHMSTTRLCTKALIQKMKREGLQIYCEVSDDIEYVLKESDDGYHIDEESLEWLDKFHEIVKSFKNKILEKNLKVIVPVGIDFLNSKGAVVAGHAIIGVLSRQNSSSIIFQIYDGNGFVESWHTEFMVSIEFLFDGSLPKVVTYFDNTQPNVNQLETSKVKEYLERVGIRYPDLEGQCAFLAYVYTLDQLCTGINTQGHALRLFQDLLHRDDKIRHLRPWEIAIISAYVMACAYRTIQIMLEFYPNKKIAVENGWNESLDFPNLNAIRPVRVSKKVEGGFLKLANVLL